MTEIDYTTAVTVVTGAARGIGEALARGFADIGATVVVGDLDGEGAHRVAASIGPKARAAHVDVADALSVAAFADSIFATEGRVDVLCNNAGVFQGGLMWERSADDYRWALDVNCNGILHAVQAFVPRMIAQGTPGHIVNTSSVAAFVIGPMSSPYTVSKAAAFALTECLAQDLGAVGAAIGVSVLTPSAFDTDIAHTAALRQNRYGSDLSGEARSVAEALATMTSEGMDPIEAVRPVLDGIRSGHFLIPTKPSFEAQLRSRYEALLERRLPPLVDVD